MSGPVPVAGDLAGIAARLAAAEARQRAYGQHDPHCPEFQRQQDQRHTDVYFPPRACTCWLTGQDPPAQDAPAQGPGSNTGHGHVWPRPDGMVARCGGPAMCKQCQADAGRWRGPVAEGW